MQITKENLTIILVTIKSHNIIDQCLESIDPNVKKVVIENSSDKSFTNYLQNKYRNIDCYITNENLGMGKANNIGIKKAKTRFVMILNPDTILRSDTLDKMYEISRDLDFAILSPISAEKNYPNFKFKNDVKKNYDNDFLLEVDQVDGYAMILDKNKFNENYFDENIFMYLENDDLCLRMINENKKIYVYTKSLINHMGGKSVNREFFDQIELSRNWHWNWSKFYYKKKHYGFWTAFISGLYIFLKSFLKGIFYFVFRKKFKSKIYFCRASGFLNALMGKKSWFRPKI